MNKLLIGLGAYLAYRVFQYVKTTEAAVADMLLDIDQTVSANVQDVGEHIGSLYTRVHILEHQNDMLTLDYLKHLQLYGHYDYEKKDMVQAPPYIDQSPDPDAMEMAMIDEGLSFSTKRQKGL